ncbi:small acid-soluble spore protein K [Tepidibacillus marianensis]
MRNKVHDFPGPKKLDHSKAKSTTLRPNGTINTDPQGKMKENR